MNPLSIARINATAPYQVEGIEGGHTYFFHTFHGVHYSVDFMEDDLLLCTSSCQLTVVNVDNKKSPRDAKLRDTIIAIVVEFFRCNNVPLLYLCETGDNKQSMRNRLFEHWFSSCRLNGAFALMSHSLVDEEGVENFVAVILRADHPQADEVAKEFLRTIQVLGTKPETPEAPSCLPPKGKS